MQEKCGERAELVRKPPASEPLGEEEKNHKRKKGGQGGHNHKREKKGKDKNRGRKHFKRSRK